MLALPEDVLAAEVDVARRAALPRRCARRRRPRRSRSWARCSRRAERPFVLVGGGPWDDGVGDGVHALGARLRAAGRRDVPPPGRRRQHCAPSYAGDVGIGVNPKLAQRIRDCDLLLAVGTRLAEIETQGYTLPAPPVAPQPLVHVHPDPAELGRVYQPSLARAQRRGRVRGRRAGRRRVALGRAGPPRRAPTTRRGSSTAGRRATASTSAR